MSLPPTEQPAREEVWRYLNDPLFYNRVNMAAQAIMHHWMGTREHFDFDGHWTEARVLAFKVIQTLEASGQLTDE